jgi:hypothetical protein
MAESRPGGSGAAGAAGPGPRQPCRNAETISSRCDEIPYKINSIHGEWADIGTGHGTLDLWPAVCTTSCGCGIRGRRCRRIRRFLRSSGRGQREIATSHQ